jgi:hypothetical protein
VQAEVSRIGRHFDLVAEENTRAAIARLAGVLELPRLEASFDVTLHGRNGLHVVGRVSGTVGQVCSVTLEPMRSEVNEDIDLVFLPAPAAILPARRQPEIEGPLGDGPEVLIDGMIDLGALATEFLVLGINPYPRKPDSVFDPPPAETQSLRAFASLGKLGERTQPSSRRSGGERKKR